MGNNWLDLLQQSNQLSQLMETNQYTSKFGLSLSETEAQLIVQERVNTLKEEKRVEFGTSIIPKIIYEFCDSAYIDQSNYVETLIQLQSIFYHYKNEMMDEITDDELLHFMKEQFEGVCYGDLEYLEGTCLNNFAQAIRAGYEGHKESDGYGEYEHFDDVKRWDYELYLQALRDMIWR